MSKAEAAATLLSIARGAPAGYATGGALAGRYLGDKADAAGEAFGRWVMSGAGDFNRARKLLMGEKGAKHKKAQQKKKKNKKR